MKVFPFLQRIESAMTGSCEGSEPESRRNLGEMGEACGFVGNNPAQTLSCP